MLTFQQIYEEVQDQVEDEDTNTSLPLIKRAINQGMRKFESILHREWRMTEKTFSTVASQQYYQLPEDCIRPKTVTVTIGNIAYPLTEVPDEDSWNNLNMHSSSETSDIPEFYYVKGDDLLGIFPIPSSSTADAGTLRYAPRNRRMTATDYTTGTITVTNDSAAIVGATTTFTAQMAGRTLLVEDGGDQDGIGYKIASFTDTTNITLENTYAGLSGASKSYRIGEVPDIPEEFHESLVDYAMFRYYRRRKDRGMAAESKLLFDEAIALCKENYSSSSSSQYVRPIRAKGVLYTHTRREYQVTGG